MNIYKKVLSSIFEVISIVFVILFILGTLNLYFSGRNEYCDMTYMFEYPQFVKISVPENKYHPQYGLYAYSEGRLTENVRKMWFDGIPVLFLPGNSGSHMQARSLASVALRKALADGYEQHFDFFTVSYNEELSGIYGGVLERQTEFTAACIAKILSLYKSNKYTKTVPTTVILIGHSMGGLVSKRLLAYPSTINATSLAITLAAPLEAPVINADVAMNNYYMNIDLDWNLYIENNFEMKQRKLLISIGNGPRDILVPPGLTSSSDSYINALTTSIPGVWVSPDHVGIVWCKQLVLTINRYLFGIIDPKSDQIVEDRLILMSKAKQYFQANRSMTLNPQINRPNVSMTADAFWYEDNRRIYQISRPDIDRSTHLMIRLVSFPQNRFVAIEAVNTTDKDWIFGCNAKFIHSSYRYCKYATSLTELSRWTGAANDFGRRKLATVNLHSIMNDHPDWTHVVVKVSPTKRPVTLNVDVNDYASRQIHVDVGLDFYFGNVVVKQETEPNSLYYELHIKGFQSIHQAYLLYVEPTASCKATKYHVSAEMNIPWAENHQYYHYFTHVKRSPMKMILFKSNPNVSLGLDPKEYAKVTILLDPQCTFTISVSASWYYGLGQLVRNYTPILIAYKAAIVLLAARSNIMNLMRGASCVTMHSALRSDEVKPYYILVFGRLGAMVLMSVPFFAFLFENASWKNLELHYFIKSLLVLPAYITALGLLNVTTASILCVMVFSSQLAHRLLFRIVWRGGGNFAEKLASGLQKVPLFVSAGLIAMAPISCGAASLAVGAAFYAFMLSKMYEEYLEDFIYKLIIKFIVSKFRAFVSKKSNTKTVLESNLVSTQISLPSKSPNDLNTLENKTDKVKDEKESDATKKPSEIKNDPTEILNTPDRNETTPKVENLPKSDEATSNNDAISTVQNTDHKHEICNKTNSDEELSNLNFHMTLFIMWLVVTLVNVPALLTWARNFKYSLVLMPDTSYHTGLIMSACSAYLWQIEGPRKNLKHYESVGALLFTMSVFILTLGPLSLYVVNYGVTFMFAIITIQQLCDSEIPEKHDTSEDDVQYKDKKEANQQSAFNNKDGENNSDSEKYKGSNKDQPDITKIDNDCEESRIFNVFKNLKEKLSFNDVAL